MKKVVQLRVGGLLLSLVGIGIYSSMPALPSIPPGVFTNNGYSMKTEHTFGLPDGRVLGYAEYGDPEGFPVFFFHGGQESRLSSSFMDSTAAKLQVRIIAPDRPGIGLSTFQENRTFLAWGRDIGALADHLKLEEFSIFGLSGGAPHVLACAYLLSNRIVKTSIVSGTGPHNYKGKLRGTWFPVKLLHWFASAKSDENLRGFITSERKTLTEKPEKRLRQLQRFLPKPDRKLLRAVPEYGIDFIKGSQEAYRQGTEAIVQEWKLYVTDWNLPLEEITNKINLWYGTDDKMAPKYRGIHLNRILKNSELHIFENEGHFSLVRNHLKTILSDLKPNSMH